MDEIIGVIVIIAAIIGAISQNNKGKQKQGSKQSIFQPKVQNKTQTGTQPVDILETVKSTMEKSMSQGQRELRTRLEKKYQSMAQQTKTASPYRQTVEQQNTGRQDVKGQVISYWDLPNITIGSVENVHTSELMRQVNDLILMGYQSDLPAARDFVSEGIEMLNRFEVLEN